MLAIYQAGLDTGDASFETAAPAWDAFDQGKLPLRRHVAVAVTAGFRIVGTRQRIGSHHGYWRDVTLLERPRPITGI